MTTNAALDVSEKHVKTVRPVAVAEAPVQGTGCCEVAGCCDGSPRLRLAADRATELADMLKAIAHPVRLQMVDLLSRHGGDVCVCDIESQFDLKQPTISHHLKILRKAQIVDCQRQGSWLYYYIRPEAMGTLRSLLSEWTEQVAAH